MLELMVDLQGGAKAPLYEKIYRHIRSEIVEGRLKKGEKLPSTRLMAKNIAVSRSTVEMAYEQLLAEGYIEAEPCRGFFVCDIRGLYRIGQGEEFQKEEAVSTEGIPCRIDFSPYVVDTKSFPYNVWRKINRQILLEDREELLLAGDGQGEPGLRKSIMNYLHHARGVNCRSEDIILGAGNEYLEILLTQLLGQGRTVLMEDPGYPQAYHTFSKMGYTVETVPAEAGGLDDAAVRNTKADLVYVMPSHQFPLGSVMPLGERMKLLQWAGEKEGRYLIEDDHDSEYRYRGKPIPSLQSIDRNGRVIYLGTFSKSVAPSLRISYLVLPPQLTEIYRRECGFYAPTVSRILQDALKAFLEGGYFERHLNKMRGIYRSRHDFLLAELKGRRWAGKISGEYAGLHLLVYVKSELTEEEICRRARMRGVKISGLTEYCLQRENAVGTPALLLGYGGLDEEEICQGLRILDGIIEQES